MSGIYVFTGPTISPREAATILSGDDVHFLPPVQMGDVVRVMAHEPSAIAIIDGVFERVPAVWHKEILFALSRGVRVLGSSSMGALRAAELAAFGMEGVGQIFEAYRDGTFEDDDEVAVVHASADEDYRQLSEPMVNVREGLRRAREAGALSPESEALLVDAAKARFYPDRSWLGLLQEAPALGVPAREVEALVRAFPQPPNVKRADAGELLRRLADPTHPRPERVLFDFQPTTFWTMLVANEAPADAPGAGVAVTFSALERHAKIERALQTPHLERALLAYLCVVEAGRCSVAIGDPAARMLFDRLRASSWLSPDEINTLVDRLCVDLPRALGRRLNPFLAAAIVRAEGAPVLDAVRRKSALLARLGGRPPRLVDAGIDLEQLSVWYEERFGELTESGEAHAHKLGFVSWEEFLGEAIAHYLLDASAK